MTPNIASNKGIAFCLATTMFVLSLVFLGLVATLIVVWVEIPRFSAISEVLSSGEALSSGEGLSPEAEDEIQFDPMTQAAAHLGGYVIIAAWLLGFVIVGEVIVQHCIQVRRQRPDEMLKWRLYLLAQVICPPLRLASPSLERQGQIWLPWIGWQTPGRKLFKRLQAAFSRPMLFFAMLILPVLLVEYGLRSQVEQHSWLQLTLHICTGLIWCAFAVEFIILFNATERKLAYVKSNWLDLAIILLPLIMILRTLRALQILRAAKAHQLMKLSRVYRVRGVAMKAFRALMLLEVFGRLIPVSPEKKLKRLQSEYDEKKEELD